MSSTLPEAVPLESSPERSNPEVVVAPRRLVSNTALVERVQTKGMSFLRSLSGSKLGVAVIETDDSGASKPEEIAAALAAAAVPEPSSGPQVRVKSLRAPIERPGHEVRGEGVVAPIAAGLGVRVEGVPPAALRSRGQPAAVPSDTHIRVPTSARHGKTGEFDDDGVPTLPSGAFGLRRDPLADVAADVSPRRVAHVLESMASLTSGVEAAEYLSLAERLREYAELLEETRVLGTAAKRARRLPERLWVWLRARLFARRVVREITRRERTLIPCVVSGRSLLMELIRVHADERFDAPPRFNLRIYGELGPERSWGRRAAPPPTYFEVTRVVLGRGPRRLNARELASLFWPELGGRRRRRGSSVSDPTLVWVKRKGLTQGPVPSPAFITTDRLGDCTQDSLVMFLQSNLSERFRDRVLGVLQNLGILSELEDVLEPTLESEVPEELRDTDASLCLDAEIRYAEERTAIEGKPWFAGTMTSAAADARILETQAAGPKIVFFIYQSKDVRRDFILAFAWVEKEKTRVIRHKVLSFRSDGTFALDRSSKCFRHVEDVANMMMRIGYAPIAG